MRILIRNVISSSKLSRAVTLGSDVKRPEEGNTKDCILHVLKLLGSAAAETNALDGNDGHDILEKTHWASPGAKSTTSNKTSTKNHTVCSKKQQQQQHNNMVKKKNTNKQNVKKEKKKKKTKKKKTTNAMAMKGKTV